MRLIDEALAKYAKALGYVKDADKYIDMPFYAEGYGLVTWHPMSNTHYSRVKCKSYPDGPDSKFNPKTVYAAPTLDELQAYLRNRYKLHITLYSKSQESWMFRVTRPHEDLKAGVYGEDFDSYEDAQEAALRKAVIMATPATYKAGNLIRIRSKGSLVRNNIPFHPDTPFGATLRIEKVMGPVTYTCDTYRNITFTDDMIEGPAFTYGELVEVSNGDLFNNPKTEVYLSYTDGCVFPYSTVRQADYNNKGPIDSRGLNIYRFARKVSK